MGCHASSFEIMHYIWGCVGILDVFIYMDRGSSQSDCVVGKFLLSNLIKNFPASIYTGSTEKFF